MPVPLRPGDRVALLTSGGDAPGMNAGLRAAAKVGTALGLEVLGVEDGYRGLMEGRLRALDMRALDEACRRGGTLLGSARSKEFPTPQGQARAREAIAAARLAGLLVFGGNGSLAGAHALAGTPGADGNELRVGGVPASIDNDIGCTTLAIGVDTAMNTIVEACDRIADTALSHQRTFIIEVMGRDCGYLAMAAGIAAAADAVLFREGKQSDDEIVDQVMRAIEAAYARQGGRRHVLVIKSEGVRLDSQRLKHMVDERIRARGMEVDTRVTVLGHVVRGGAPSAFDRLLAARLAAAAMRALRDGHTQFMVGWAGPGQARSVCAYDHHVTLWPLGEVLAETERMHSGDSAAVQARVRAMKEVESVLYL
ncbi:MAG: 6-phosphofructokinase [Myxococcales bacterium]|nr:6-phosphofructokinase [Myxococcota bacterium]MDW8282002.1 6-phosphofructokinase [Myxococcales bacterium]